MDIAIHDESIGCKKLFSNFKYVYTKINITIEITKKGNNGLSNAGTLVLNCLAEIIKRGKNNSTGIEKRPQQNGIKP